MRIRRAALRLLAERGVELQGLEGEAGLRRALDAAQLRLEGNVARFDPDFVSEMIALAPAAFRIEPRNPARTITVGGRYMLFGAVASATEIWDLQRGRRSGDLAACEDLLRLAQSFNCIHFLGGYPVEPQDIPPPMRHLVCAEAALRLTDKVIHAYPLGPDAVRDVMTLARLAAGLDEAEFAAKPRLYVNINSAGPLTFDASVLAATLCAARSGQAVMVTPLVMAEAGSGVTVAGMATLALAEALAVVALVQQVRPGTPVILGALSACLGPTFRAPVFGTAESLRMTEALAQIARSLRLPFRATAASTANIADAQAMAETANSLWSGVRSGANMLQHAAGWLSRGTAASAEAAQEMSGCPVQSASNLSCVPKRRDRPPASRSPTLMQPPCHRTQKTTGRQGTGGLPADLALHGKQLPPLRPANLAKHRREQPVSHRGRGGLLHDVRPVPRHHCRHGYRCAVDDTCRYRRAT